MATGLLSRTNRVYATAAQAGVPVLLGKTEVPAILLKPIVVTKDNVKTTVVADGFQTLKRINEGLPAEQQIK